MPVRIYEIARKLGLDSKTVISKAKELGIAHAKVASSTLDKITAEFLEGSLTPTPTPTPPPPPTAPELSTPPPTADTTPTTQEITSTAPDSPTPAEDSPTPPTPTLTATEAEVPAPPATPIPTPTESAAAVIVPEPDQPGPILTPSELSPKSDLPASELIPPPDDATPAPAPLPPTPLATETPHSPLPDSIAPVEAPVLPTDFPPSPEPIAEPQASPTVITPPPPPPPPVAPPSPQTRVPGLGELVGRIELPQRSRPSARPGTPPPPPPAPTPPPAARRPEPPRGRSGPPSFGQNRPSHGYQGGRPPLQQPPRPPSPPPAAPKGPAVPDFTAPADGIIISIKPPIIVRDLADRMGIKAYRLLHDLMELGVFASLNQAIDEKVAQYIAARHGFRFEVERREKGGGQVHAPIRKVEIDTEDKIEDLQSRPPVITIMGHVDHGKTSLLDVIRKSDVVAKEAGGITQHIGAYTIQVPHPERPQELQQLTFLDTPGHAAFSAMRARGAHVTDIVILVVAASEGIMPQTIEALNHAKAARVPILVAVNKSDLPSANPQRVRQQLQDHGLVAEEWGGETIFVDVSATTKKGIDKLLAMLVLQAEILELKANPKRRAKGNVIESGVEPGGPTATVLIRKGTLHLGDVILCGPFYGRTRALIDEEGKRLKEAGPSVAVKVLGLNGIPEAGLEFMVVENEKAARQMAEEREQKARTVSRDQGPRVTLENLLSVIEQQSAKILKVVIKADTQGSVEAIVDALRKIDSHKVSLEVIHSAVGTISKDDVMLAASAKGIVVGFHTRLDNGVPAIAKREGVQIKQYEIIYELIDEVRKAMAGLLDPELRETTLGAAEVRQLFDLSKGGRVAGCMVLHGRIIKGKARVVRRKEVIHDGILQTLRRYQDEVAEVRSGLECGIRVSSFEDFLPGDVVESYSVEKVPQQL